ncbi:MAG TPA: hypothetical protein VK745_05055 [Polyangiaceae bacterium]|jgi:hypothetical protein|nr:hypothetical protein [Polyangiaceae bacterium]
MHLSVVTFVSIVTAFVLSATRILSASKWLWNYLPALLQGLLPCLVVALPAFAQGLVGAQSWTDVTVAFLVAGALVVPGIHSHTVALLPPNGPGSAVSGGGRGSIAAVPPPPPSAAMRGLPTGFFACLMVAALCVSGCAWFKGSFWPKVENCAPSPASLVAQVGDILAAGGDYESAFETLAVTAGKDAVVCAVEAFVSSIGASDGAHTDAVARGRAFLAQVAAQ